MILLLGPGMTLELFLKIQRIFCHGTAYRLIVVGDRFLCPKNTTTEKTPIMTSTFTHVLIGAAMNKQKKKRKTATQIG
jgi:hypothetical protein